MVKKYFGRDCAPLSRASKLTGNRQIEFLSLSQLRFQIFDMLETFVVFLGYIVFQDLLSLNCLQTIHICFTCLV